LETKVQIDSVYIRTSTHPKLGRRQPADTGTYACETDPVATLIKHLLVKISTTPVNYVYKSDLPESIQRRIKQLHEQEKQIVELEVELSQLRNDYAQLERDLEPYRISSSSIDVTLAQRTSRESTHYSHIETASINRCPAEILCLIFEEYTLISRNHVFIRCLLLVCRRWYLLVANTAKLWARIEILEPWDLLDIISKKPQSSYISACLNRSKDLPITVDLDLEYLVCANYIIRELTGYAKTTVDEAHHDSITRVIENVQWDYFTSAKFEVEVERVFERLAGVDGEHIKRWRKLTLRLPGWGRRHSDIGTG
jgi:hypothetical protein